MTDERKVRRAACPYPLLTQCKIEVDIHKMGRAETLIEQSSLTEQAALECQTKACNRFDFNLLTLLKVTQAVGQKTQWTSQAHFFGSQSFCQWRKNIPRQLNIAVKKKNIAATALLQSKIASLRNAHSACRT